MSDVQPKDLIPSELRDIRPKDIQFEDLTGLPTLERAADWTAERLTPPMPDIPDMPAAPGEDPAVAEEAERRRRARLARQGRAGTILTSPLGVEGGATRAATLLGS